MRDWNILQHIDLPQFTDGEHGCMSFRHHFLSSKIQIFPKLEVRAENSLLLNHHIRGDQPAGRGRYELCPRMALRTALGTALARVGLRSDDEHTIMIIMPGM